MARKPIISDDNWHNEKDSKKRKQIQDRLAQRARRQRLREAKNNAKRAPLQSTETPRTDEAQHDEESHVTVSTTGPHLVPHDTFTPPSDSSWGLEKFHQSEQTLSSFDLGNISFCGVSTEQLQQFVQQNPPVPSPTTAAPFPITVLGALYLNGRILGLTCSCSMPSRSLPASSDVPPPLHPTKLQLTIIHPRWVDRIPFPKMRDNLITMFGLIDDEEIIEDIFTMPSFQITPGCATWDPRAWKIEKPFADKWGYLLF